MSFSQRVKQLMDEHGLNLTEAADRTGVNISTLSKVLRGDSQPQIGTVLKIANAFQNLRFDWLLRGNGAQYQISNDLNHPTTGDTAQLVASLTRIEDQIHVLTPRRQADLLPVIYELGVKLVKENEKQRARLFDIKEKQIQITQLLSLSQN